MNLNELLEQRARLIQEAQDLMDAAPEGRGMTAEQEERFDRCMADADGLDKQIAARKREDALQAAKASLAEPARQIAMAHRAASQYIDYRGGEDYRLAFFDYIKSGQASELRALTLATNDTPKAGYTVPVTTEGRIVEKLYQNSIMRQLCPVRSTPDDRKIPLEGALPTAAIIGEGSTITPSDPGFGQATVSAFKYATQVVASRELLDDSLLNLESWIIDRSALAIARLQDEHFWDGDASGKPKGVIDGLTAAGNKVQLANSTSQTTAITAADSVVDWIYKLPVQYRRGAVILTSDEVVKNMRKIKDSNNNYIWLASDVNTLMAGGAPGTIMGVPYYISEYVDALAASKYVAIYGNFNYYEIYDRGATEIFVDPYSAAATWQMKMIVVKRSDAVRTNDDAFKMLQMAAS